MRHHPHLPWNEISGFYVQLESWRGSNKTKLPLRLLALTYVRTI